MPSWKKEQITRKKVHMYEGILVLAHWVEKEGTTSKTARVRRRQSSRISRREIPEKRDHKTKTRHGLQRRASHLKISREGDPTKVSDR